MSQVSCDMHELKGKLDTFIQNEEYLKTYYKASEAERIHRAEISFARKEGVKEGKKRKTLNDSEYEERKSGYFTDSRNFRVVKGRYSFLLDIIHN